MGNTSRLLSLTVAPTFTIHRAVMGAVPLGVIVASTFKPRTHRVFFYITAAINFTATIAYFAIGSNLGWTPIDVEFMRSEDIVAGRNREIFYVRYIDWFVTAPLLLMDLLLTAGLPWPTIIWTIFMDWVMIITGLVGALVKTIYKWGFYTFGCAAMLYVFWAVLDFCAKPVFSIMLIVGHWNIDPAILGLRICDVQQSPELYSKERFAAKRDPAMHGAALSTGMEGAAAGLPRSRVGENGTTEATPPTTTQ